MMTARKTVGNPTIYLVLKRNMSTLDLVNNEKSLRDEARKIIQQEEDDIVARIKLEERREDRRKAREDHEKVMEFYRNKRRWSVFCYGLLNFIIVSAIFLIFTMSSLELTENQ